MQAEGRRVFIGPRARPLERLPRLPRLPPHRHHTHVPEFNHRRAVPHPLLRPRPCLLWRRRCPPACLLTDTQRAVGGRRLVPPQPRPVARLPPTPPPHPHSQRPVNHHQRAVPQALPHSRPSLSRHGRCRSPALLTASWPFLSERRLVPSRTRRLLRLPRRLLYYHQAQWPVGNHRNAKLQPLAPRRRRLRQRCQPTPLSQLSDLQGVVGGRHLVASRARLLPRLPRPTLHRQYA